MPTKEKPMFRPLLAAVAVILALAPPLAAAGAPNPYSEGYAAGYRAAMEAVKKALAEGRSAEAATTVTEVPQPLPSAPAATPPANAEPRDWWNHSSLRYALRDDAWRHGLQAQLSYTGVTGNDDGTAWRGNGQFHSRLGRWTNELSLTLDKREIKSADGGVNQRDYRMLQESLRYDLTDRWYVAGGFILERDDVALVDRRVTGLLGAGYYWIDNERFRLNTYLGLGHVDERYMRYVREHVEVNSRNSGLLYFYQTFSWQISENFSLRQGFRLMQDLDRSGRYAFDPAISTPPSAEFPQGFERYSAIDQVRRYRTVTGLDFDYKLSPRSSVSLGIESRYDSNPWPDVIRRDIVRRVNFNLMF
jgi:putative salt-induced outer membrane protein YdiY